MGFFTKKDSKTIELPALPGMPAMPNLPPLPDLPEDSSQPSQFQQSISPPQLKDELPSIPPSRRAVEIENIAAYQPKVILPVKEIIREPLFIKLDKFRDAVTKFEEIKKKAGEIENALARVREIKEKEEQEIRLWTGEIQLIKEKISSIDISLFSRI